MPGVDSTPRRVSSYALVFVIVAAALGAMALARQRPNPRLSTPISPPAWPSEGHDAQRTSHSLSNPSPNPVALLWQRALAEHVRRTPLIDGNSNVFISQTEGSVLALGSSGATSWCVALQPITDTNCTGPAEPATAVLPPPVAPNVTIGPIGPAEDIYVLNRGMLGLYSLAPFSQSPTLEWKVPSNLVPEDGVVFGPAGTMYGVIPARSRREQLAFAVVELGGKGAPVRGWNAVPLASRGVSPPAVAPDGLVVVAATSAAPGQPAQLYALGPNGKVAWRVSLAPGQTSAPAIEGAADDWVAWVAGVAVGRSWVIVVDRHGRTLWRWSTGHPLSILNHGIALAHPSSRRPEKTGLGYAGSSIGVYAFDLERRHAWLFANTRGLGRAGSPITDVQNTVYFATSTGRIFDVWQSGVVRWQYDTYRFHPGSLSLFPNGALFVTTTDASGVTVAEALGAGGTPLTPHQFCAPVDCPTPTATATPSATNTATSTPVVTLTPTATLISTAAATSTTPEAGLTATLTTSPTPAAAPGGSVTPQTAAPAAR